MNGESREERMAKFLSGVRGQKFDSYSQDALGQLDALLQTGPRFAGDNVHQLMLSVNTVKGAIEEYTAHPDTPLPEGAPTPKRGLRRTGAHDNRPLLLTALLVTQIDAVDAYIEAKESSLQGSLRGLRACLPFSGVRAARADIRSARGLSTTYKTILENNVNKDIYNHPMIQQDSHVKQALDSLMLKFTTPKPRQR